ncbi:hypothetical protein [Kribbella sp. NPDC048915]|uniref:hypothetical protein n=1 Tax=Kribbella sp. NPDC048915 TaxID=3155148 RepID=UPI0033CAE34E
MTMPAPAKKSILPKVAIACFVVGAILAGFFVWRIVDTAPRSPQPIEAGVVHLKKEGVTIYASVPVPTPPCEVRDADGNDVPVERPGGSETITINGDSWYVVARSTQPVPAGDYSISCTDDETSATYAAGPRSSVLGFVLSIFGLVFSLLIFIGLGVTLLGVGALKQRRARRGNTFPAQPGAYGNYPHQPQQPHQPGPAGQPGQSGQPGQPPNHTFPAPPAYRPGPNPDRPQDRPYDPPQDR